MSGPFDPRNPDNWQQVFSQQFVAQPATRVPNGYIPIPETNIPILLTSPILMVDTDAPDAAPSWWLAGSLRMKIDGPFIGSADLFAQRRRVPVNRVSLIRFPRLVEQYSVAFAVVPWIREIRVQILEYVGPATDALTALVEERTDLIRVDLVRLEAKIDDLRANGNP